MPWAAAIGAGASLLGAYMSSNASSDAANTQANSANNATNAQLKMYNQNVDRLSPWVSGGQNALGNLSGLLGSNGSNGVVTSPFTLQQFQESPGYQFQLQQGDQAILNNASALGGVNSGNTLKSLSSFNQGLANQDYQQALQNYTNWQNQLYNMNAGVANLGENAAAQTGSMGTQVANQIGSNMIGAGNALAAGQIGSSNAWANGLSNVGQLGMYAMMKKQGNSGVGGYGSFGGYGGGVALGNSFVGGY